MSADLERRLTRLERDVRQLDRRLTMAVDELRSQVLRLSGYQKPTTDAADETVEAEADSTEAEPEASSR